VYMYIWETNVLDMWALSLYQYLSQIQTECSAACNKAVLPGRSCNVRLVPVLWQLDNMQPQKTVY
jgi:hypothetical protein